MGFGRRSRGARPGKRTKRIGVVGVVAFLALLAPAMALAAGGAFYQFNFPAGHGYTLLGTAETANGKTGLNVQLLKDKLQGKDVFNTQTYAFSGFPATLSVNGSRTKATLTANLGTYGSVSLKFGDAKAAKVLTIKCPGSSKKTKIDEGVKLGTTTGSITFNSGLSYFGTVTGHKTTKSSLSKGNGILATRQLADPMANAAASSTGIFACVPALTGKLTYLELAAQGATGIDTTLNTAFASRLGNDTILSATDSPLDTGSGPIFERSISVDALGKSVGAGLFSYSSNFSSASAKAAGPFMSGSVSYHETTPCANTSKVTYGDTTGGLTAKFDAGGAVTYGGSGTVDEMWAFPALCNNPPPNAP